jgi:hypothetical protein
MASRNRRNPAVPSIFAIIDPPAAVADEAPGPVSTVEATPPDPAPAPRLWRIYRISRTADGRSYVGVTRRRLTVRLAMHDQDARWRPNVGGPDTLAAAIRQAYARGVSSTAAFKAEILAVTSSPGEARCLERAWIAALGTAPSLWIQHHAGWQSGRAGKRRTHPHRTSGAGRPVLRLIDGRGR